MSVTLTSTRKAVHGETTVQSGTWKRSNKQDRKLDLLLKYLNINSIDDMTFVIFSNNIRHEIVYAQIECNEREISKDCMSRKVVKYENLCYIYSLHFVYHDFSGS